MAVLASIFFFHFTSYLMNYRWIVTAVAQTFNVIATVIFLAVFRGFKDIIIIAIVVASTYLAIMASYICERKLKSGFIQLWQI